MNFVLFLYCSEVMYSLLSGLPEVRGTEATFTVSSLQSEQTPSYYESQLSLEDHLDIYRI
jgi:hypothetical protein